jgi:beta-glucosidase
LKIDGRNFSGIAPVPGNLHGDTIQANQHNLLPTPDGLDNIRRLVKLTAGKHAIELSLTGDTSNSPEQIRLNWVTPPDRQKNRDAAIAAAKESKTAIVFAWSRGNPNFALPGDQDKLIDEVASVNPNTIVVLNVSQPVAMPWLGKVKAVLQMWWPGDEGGPATANILLGKTSPAGRLPFTWARRLEDYCCSANPAYPERTAAATNVQTSYSEGIYVGYRWFDKEKIDPLFPFGFGLSYGKFDYSDLKTRSSADGGLDVSFKVRNSSTFASDEVPQVYLGPPATLPAGISFAARALAGFARIHLEPGQEQAVTVHVPMRRLQYWSDTTKQWQTMSGARPVMVGRSSRDLPLKSNLIEK